MIIRMFNEIRKIMDNLNENINGEITSMERDIETIKKERVINEDYNN